jgi:hypothetical protein
VIGSNGYVGIGTQSPEKPLTIDAGDNDALYLLSNSSDDWYVGPNVAATGFGIYDVTQAASRLHIETGGNVGIATTDPNYPLDVNGIAQAVAFEARSNGGTPYVDFSNDTTSDYDARFILTGDDTLALQGTTDFSMDANVGIGTNYSDAELHVNDPSSGATVKVSGNNGTYGLYMGADSNGPWIGSYTDDDSRIFTNTEERLHIGRNGNIGIGLGATVDANLDLAIGDSDTGFNHEEEDVLAFYTGAAEVMRLTSDHNVKVENALGIGVAPDYLLSIGEADMGFNPVDTDALGFFTAGTEVMRLTSGGNVKIASGIGVGTAPNYPVHVFDASSASTPSSSSITTYIDSDAQYALYSRTSSGDSNSIGVFGEATHTNPDTSGGTFGVLGRVDRTSGSSGHSSAGVFGDAFGPDADGDGKPEAFDSLANGVQGETWSTNSQAAGGKFIAAQETGEAIGVDAWAYSDDATGLRIVSDGKLIEGRACNESNSDGIDSDGDGSDTDSACSSSTVVFKVTNGGNVTADGTYSTPASDLAEYVNTLDDLQPGEVIEIDPTRPDHFRRSQTAQSRLVAGVVSTQPGVILGFSEGVGLSTKVLLALAGRVPVKVTNENGPIQIGDLLVTSSTPGYAMKCTVAWRCAGAVLGKALENMNEEEGTVMTLISLQ